MNETIERLYAVRQRRDGEFGERLNTLVQHDAGAYLYDLARRERATRTLEVGLAHGGSALFLCQALADGNGGLHTAIDPKQEQHYDGRGVRNVEDAGLGAHFRFVEGPSYDVLPTLLREEGDGTYDLVFIDGNHTFDFALVDFFYADRLLRPGGVVALDDLWMPSIRRLASFILRNRAYTLVEADGADRTPLGRRVLRTLGRAARDPFTDRRLLLHPLNVCAFRKEHDDDGKWDDHRRF